MNTRHILFILIIYFSLPIAMAKSGENAENIGNLDTVGKFDTDITISNSQLTELFNDYEAETDTLVGILANMMKNGGDNSRQWTKVHKIAVTLGKKSYHLMKLGILDDNPTWEHYASNLYHHCQELEEAALQKDGKESIFLVAILVSHIGQIQSANPKWLRWYLGDVVKTLEKGIANRDKDSSRDASEILHTSATKILLSASIAPEVYKDTNWRRNISQINGVGDAILGAVNKDHWDGAQEQALLIKHILSRWVEGFKVSANEK
ncbi:MAG: hypothetical protein HQL69_13615 [Magnetococcales bacterium]|nr:hypothetical protein [Magnetococcales bacterium]